MEPSDPLTRSLAIEELQERARRAGVSCSRCTDATGTDLLLCRACADGLQREADHFAEEMDRANDKVVQLQRENARLKQELSAVSAR